MAGLTAAFGFPYSSQLLLSGHSCCDSSAPQVPAQSPHVCACQLEQVKMNALPIGLLPRANFTSSDPSMIFGATRREHSSTVYPPLLRQCDVKDMSAAAAATLNPAAWFVNPRYEQNFERNTYMACSRFGDRFSPIDLNSSARRKNATRETTSTLKAWLYEHRKNPYPTKGEKIMLAILTKMTLTQVSTWFANARRRLKKENKMTWSPRNRCGERKDSEGYSEEEEDDDNEEDEIKNDHFAQERDANICRKTTVIKTPEDVKKSYQVDLITCNKDEEMKTRDSVCAATSDQTMSWPNARSPAKTDHARVVHTSNVQDSPVKSLRKWVDGCFDMQTARPRHTEQTPVTDTPPQTPPSADSLTEAMTLSTECERLQAVSPRLTSESSLREKTQDRLNEPPSNGTTTNREIDAALALTTLFTRS